MAPDCVGGGKGARTPGLRLAKPALSQLSYTPVFGTHVPKPDKSAPATFVWCEFAPSINKRPGGDSAHAGAFITKNGGPYKIRTCDLTIISRAL